MKGMTKLAGAVAAAVLLANHASVQRAVHAHLTAARPGVAAATAIAYAEAQRGKPYLWAAAGPAAFDCSGLVYRAYGSHIPRTSQQQFAAGPRVPDGQEDAGDLVFFPGVDGTMSAPGHVGMVIDPKRHLMVDAYGAGTVIRSDTYGPASTTPGLTVVVGFTDPAGRSR